MATKLFCDKCGKRITSGYAIISYTVLVDVEGRIREEDDPVDIDLCPRCFDELYEHLPKRP